LNLQVSPEEKKQNLVTYNVVLSNTKEVKLMRRTLLLTLVILLVSAMGLASVYSNASSNNLEGVKEDLKSGGNINELGYNNKSALMTAVDYGYAEIARFLIESGADIFLIDNDGFTALHYAARKGLTEIAKLLVERGAEIDKYPDSSKFYAGYTPLILACDSSRDDKTLEVVKYLVEKGANLEKVEFAFKSPLTAAVFAKSTNTIRFLLESGANPNNALNDGRTPLYLAISEGLPFEAVDVLLAKGADVSLGTEYYTPLGLAVSKSSHDVTKRLIDFGADYLKVDSLGNTILHNAARSGSTKNIELFVGLGIDINSINMEGDTPLHIAAEREYFRNVELLISLGADVLAKNNNGYLPLHIHLAVYKESKDTIELLLSKGVSINQNEVEFGFSPLHLAAGNGMLEMVKFLVEKGADISIQADKKIAPLHMAVGRYGKVEVIDYLLEKGANINVEDEDGKIPIFYAVIEKNLEAASHLAERGADINHVDLLGMTTAHYAVQDKWDGIEMLKILRQFGVPVNIKDNSGKMPEDYAASEEIKEFLRSLY